VFGVYGNFSVVKKSLIFMSRICVCVSNFNLWKTFSEASATLTQAFGNESMSQTQTHDYTNGLKR
jgi:hypothetical protein